MKRIRELLPVPLLVLAGLALFLGPAGAQEGTYLVIVHRTNPTTSISKEQLRAIYLKRAKRWDDGVSTMPVNLTAASAERQQFSAEILGKKVSEMNAYWRRKLFSGSDAPPLELALDGDVLGYVSNFRGAIGYVSARAYSQAANVKVVTITN